MFGFQISKHIVTAVRLPSTVVCMLLISLPWIDSKFLVCYATRFCTFRMQTCTPMMLSCMTLYCTRTANFLLSASYKSEAPFAHLRRPDVIDDVNIPVQKFYKEARWFPGTPRKGTVYVKPDTAHLTSHFGEQIDQVWEVRMCSRRTS